MERDDVSETFSSTADGDSIFTPPTSKLGDHSCPPTIVGDNIWDGYCSSAVPWPGNTYMIIEKDSGRPLNRNDDGGVSLGKADDTPTAAAHSQWLCVEKNNHIGFQNPQSGCYLGHNGRNCATASAWMMKEWERISTAESALAAYA
ncbi:hypothetical protein PG989_004535 [Apiospora arundinis]